MAMIAMNDVGRREYLSPLARCLMRIASWQEARHARNTYRRSLAEIPEHLRQDIGLDGGARLQAGRHAGRTFIRDDRPDSSLSSWFW
ncbi:hypothetical protein SAMN05421538_104114 [Paracoccus isoporae]|uniref:DUF1127 domain-containing protein n=1 Tax=Paracoccus isoporae TaxID=591205 RepID=A0A1G7AEM3_9RHOB|nr:hypothetical protein [Paracoccus isoporae]SDE13271.1 hypothetical protein SAMN05421538_104114 [Paracoccus isoporae]